jgi:hypothetical protein
MVLQWAYRQVYETLLKMVELGDGLPLLVAARLLAEDDSPDFLPDNRPRSATDDLVWQDYQLRSSFARTRSAEPELFTQLLKAKHRRTVRKLVNRSQWLRGSRLGRLLCEQADKFIEIKASARFPRSPARQIEFLARCLGAMLVGYEPSTGDRYVPGLVQWCSSCNRRPAAIDLIQTDQTHPVLRVCPWCGGC